MDHLSTSIVSSCCKMHDVLSKGITCGSHDSRVMSCDLPLQWWKVWRSRDNRSLPGKQSTSSGLARRLDYTPTHKHTHILHYAHVSCAIHTQNILSLLADFNETTLLYKAAHVFLLDRMLLLHII